MPSIPPELCIRCKGYKLLCGLPRCPLLERFRAQVEAVRLVSGRNLQGSTPPSVLVGEAGYPRVSFYYMVPPNRFGEDAAKYDAPRLWAAEGVPLSTIIALRGSLVAASQRVDVREPWRLYESEVGLAAVSESPVPSSVFLKMVPTPRLRFDGITKPVGPRAPAEKIDVEGSPKLSRTVESAIWDDERASVMVAELYDKGVDVYRLQDLMSLGFLGRLRNRRMVPTRWAITAVDDIVSSHLRDRLRGAESVGSIEAYRGEYLGNRFLILLLPGEGTFEWVEAWHPLSAWAQGAERVTVWRVEEDPLGRTSAMDGGFSAARLAVLESLASRGRTADVVIIREVLPSYYAPVGNWHIRETVRRAMSSRPLELGSLSEARELAAQWLVSDEKAEILGASRLLTRPVRKLTEFMR